MDAGIALEETMLEAANNTLRERVLEARKDYITEETWKLIEERGTARREGYWKHQI